ncbi:hypothetical protein [Candidatus Thiothrix anitrata]|jgi:uncharacterized protein YecE (DUF72 family)|uniref:DUF72 domain-containing protein n=1 Tax=Candidatus Thiothrix anitrata TaxID=2823902 RepID=A0ABX7X0T8_9GAMM|nr:hypothetical protein [Candidatus Thiothrix anitrata]QTR49311.1 hypothetical protein J8380_13755 [Candidatus Thiothrix anitrata]
MTLANPGLMSLTLAAYGWMPQDWEQCFYPEDLPSTWRLGYYCNEFNEVLVPAAAWGTGALSDDWSVLPVGFDLYLEINLALLQSAHWVQVRECIETVLAQHINGLWVDTAARAHLPADWEQRFSVHEALNDALLAQMPAEANAQLALLRTGHTLTAVALRELFEQLREQTAHKDVVLFLDAPYPVVAQIQLMRQIYNI